MKVKKLLGIAGIATFALVSVCGCQKQNAQSTTNYSNQTKSSLPEISNNPLNNVNYKFKRSSDDHSVVLVNTQNRDVLNLFAIMLKKNDNNSEVLRFLEEHNEAKNVYLQISDNDYDDFTALGDHFNELLSEDPAAQKVYTKLHNYFSNHDNTEVFPMKPATDHLKVGETVEFGVNLPNSWIKEYGINTTPRRVTIKQITDDDE
ncbi:hypothetical protein [Lactobacillus intestinalis]|uniref:hypothetical protein n=1 Tax=Lactobacillus intestinalis TaxID=151781 RepID=UPI00242E8138|nr:hypothetical protein [Lactobacillus intestinalis]